MTPAVVRKNAHGGPQVRRNARLSLRDGFTAYAAPRRRIPLASVAGELAARIARLGFANLRRLDTSNGNKFLAMKGKSAIGAREKNRASYELEVE